VEFDVDAENRETCRELYLVRGISFSSGGRIEFMHICDARKKGVVPRSASDDEKVRIRMEPVVDTLRKINCRKVSVTPLGDVYPAND